MRRTTLSVLFLLTCTFVFAQKVAVKKVELAGQKIIVHYDLDDSNPNNEYQIYLYGSQNNFSTALAKVTGDVGNEVQPGINRKIEWNVTEELGPYKGKLSLEVRGKVYLPFVKLQNFDVNKKYKKGKTYPIQWKAGTNTPIHIELYKGSERVTGELNHPNNGSYSMSVPSSVKPGKDYRLKITDSKNSDEVVYSGYFKVAPKIPLLVKVLPIVAVGGIVAALSGGGGGGGGNTPPANNGEAIPTPGFPGN
jgi:hypothetical protein